MMMCSDELGCLARNISSGHEPREEQINMDSSAWINDSMGGSSMAELSHMGLEMGLGKVSLKSG